ncbi:hypothetical protein CS063_15735 [Sporanaerobium hydrogeniformans]|uniref:Uncharacterized protein n=1 Tax=Sporanaerobium hydrogeniformans TaxID=3072179 RepID=A0AC61D8Q6_9FIRM|nr:NusG domain II-containing protein [Sporanaerobium hydrogeniformans]PHV69447.1 hypothetical protein CS063_15735 [Sporanaerobium hydrogeniformans]
MIKKWDIGIIVLLLLLSFIPYLCFKVLIFKDYTATYVLITVEGKPYQKIPLKEEQEKEEIAIQTAYGKNKLVIELDQVSIQDADCPDLLCTEFRPISKVGETITCLPHKLCVEIVGEKQDEEMDTRTY